MPVSGSSSIKMNAAASAGTVPFLGSLSLATPIRPVPLIMPTAALVSPLSFSSTSWPEYLPPSSIAFFAAWAKVIDPEPFLATTRSLSSL